LSSLFSRHSISAPKSRRLAHSSMRPPRNLECPLVSGSWDPSKPPSPKCDVVDRNDDDDFVVRERNGKDWGKGRSMIHVDVLCFRGITSWSEVEGISNFFYSTWNYSYK
jgi:hypothetical protein